MQAIGQIVIEDHLTPMVAVFNATKPPREHLFLPTSSDAVRIELGTGAAGPFIRILPSPSLLALMGYALQERSRMVDASPIPSLPG